MAATVGYAGLLMGPVLIGAVASLASLRVGFLLLAVALFAIMPAGGEQGAPKAGVERPGSRPCYAQRQHGDDRVEPSTFFETLFRKQTHDHADPRCFVWPFRADDDEDAIARAEALLANWRDPNFVSLWETGNAVRILRGSREVAWKSFERGSAYAEWA